SRCVQNFPRCHRSIAKGDLNFFLRTNWQCSTFRRPTGNKFGLFFGAIAVVFLPPIAIVIPTGVTSGASRRLFQELRQTRSPYRLMPEEPNIDLQSDHYFMGEA